MGLAAGERSGRLNPHCEIARTPLHCVTSSDQLKPISQLRFHYDTTTTKNIDMLIFCSRRIASNGSRRARYVVLVVRS